MAPAFTAGGAPPGQRTVQEVVQQALGWALALPEPPELTVAGRTDAGVHARGQVAHADVPAANWLGGAGSAGRRLRRGLAPQGGGDAPALADPLRRHETLWYRQPLDLDRMNAAAAACVGEHDFAAFCRRREGATTIRELLRLDWSRTEPGRAVA